MIAFLVSCILITDDDIADRDAKIAGLAQEELEASSAWGFLAAGHRATCAQGWDEELYCWGKVTGGPPSVTLTYVDVHENICATDIEGFGHCWGDVWDINGQGPGFGSVEFVEVRSATDGDSSAGPNVCGISKQGEFACWGFFADQPGRIPAGGPWVDMAYGAQTLCGLDDAGTVVCSWAGPTAEVPAATFVAIDGQDNAACGITDEGALECWGAFSGEATYSLSDPGPYRALSVGGVIEPWVCAIRHDLTLACFGPEDLRTGRPIGDDPFDVTPPTGQFLRIAVGGRHACGRDLEGDIHCWGEGDEEPEDDATLVPDKLTLGQVPDDDEPTGDTGTQEARR